MQRIEIQECRIHGPKARINDSAFQHAESRIQVEEGKNEGKNQRATRINKDISKERKKGRHNEGKEDRKTKGTKGIRKGRKKEGKNKRKTSRSSERKKERRIQNPECRNQNVESMVQGQ